MRIYLLSTTCHPRWSNCSKLLWLVRLTWVLLSMKLLDIVIFVIMDFMRYLVMVVHVYLIVLFYHLITSKSWLIIILHTEGCWSLLLQILVRSVLSNSIKCSMHIHVGALVSLFMLLYFWIHSLLACSVCIHWLSGLFLINFLPIKYVVIFVTHSIE